MDNATARFEALAVRITSTDRRVGDVERRVREMESDVNGATMSVNEHRVRIEHVEKAIGGWRETHDAVVKLKASLGIYVALAFLVWPGVLALGVFLVKRAFAHN